MNKINNASNGDLYADYPTNSTYLKAFGSMAFTGQIIVMDTVNGDTSHFEVKATFKNLVGAPSLVGTYTTINIGEDIPGAVMVKVNIGGAGEVIINISNNYGNTVQCVCYARYTETFVFI